MAEAWRRPAVRGRRALAAALGVALAAALLPAATVAAASYQDTTVLEADDAVGTAVAFSQAAFPDGATEALLGRDDVFADSLASGAMQGTRPLLVTRGDSLAQATDAELQRLGVETVHILGGASAISQAVEDQLTTGGYTVQRHSGASRIETAVAIAKAAAPDGTAAILARATAGGQDPTQAFADSLAAGAWAADLGVPIVLTETASLSEATEAYLTEQQVAEVAIVGGTAAISAQVEAQVAALGAQVARVAGPTRFGTAVRIAEARGVGSAAQAQRVVLLDGQAADGWVSGFAAAALAASGDAGVVVLSNGAQLPPESAAFLEPGAATVDLVCAPSASTGACDGAAEALDKASGATVALDGSEVPRYGRLTGTATPVEDIAALLANGCGLDGDAIAVDQSGDFSARITGPEGPCTITFSVRSPSGDETETSFEITVLTPEQATVRPELWAAEVVSSSATEAKVRFIFSEAVIGTPYLDCGGDGAVDTSAFLLYGPRQRDANDDMVEGTCAVRDGDNPNAVTVTFPRVGFDDATTAAVRSESGRAAALDPDDNTNVLGSAPLQDVTYTPARTEGRPDLVSVGQLTTESAPAGQYKATFEFDDPVSPFTPSHYGMVFADGSYVLGQVAASDGQRRHVVMFDPSEATSPDGRPCSSCPSVQEAIAGARRGFVDRAATQPLQSVAVTADGATDGPDLVSATVNASAGTVNYTFDAPISSTGSASAYKAYDVEGDVITGSSATRFGDRVVRVAFGSGEVSKLLVGASVAAGAPGSSGRETGPQSVGIESTFEAGETLGPALEQAVATLTGVSGDRHVWSVTYRFDREVEDPGGGFVVYSADGTASTAGSCEESRREVTCEVTLGADDASQPRLAAVRAGAVTGTDNGYGNVEGSTQL